MTQNEKDKKLLDGWKKGLQYTRQVYPTNKINGLLNAQSRLTAEEVRGSVISIIDDLIRNYYAGANSDLNAAKGALYDLKKKLNPKQE